MNKYFCDILYDTDLDLNLSVISKDDPLRFIVRSRIGAPRIFFGLLFGIPCLVLIFYALSQHGIYLLLSLIFCPPLAILSLLFGMAKQQKTFIPSQGKALKSFQLLQVNRDMEIQIPKNGVLSIYKKWSSGGDSSGGCYFYHVEVQGIKGLGFCVARDEKKRDDFASDLADFLGFEIRDMGEMRRT
jgi:hypothetical protein